MIWWGLVAARGGTGRRASIPLVIDTVMGPGRGGERLQLFDDPPDALIASIAWESGDGEVTGVNAWERPRAIADFFMERVQPFVEAAGEPANKPTRRGEPLAFYLRP